MTQFAADLDDAATKAKVEADVTLGNQLKIDGTPTVFLNRKMVSGSGMGYLEELIENKSGHSHE